MKRPSSRGRCPKQSIWRVNPLLYLIVCACAFAATESKDAAALFYKANSYYESGEFLKAIDAYNEISRQGQESGNLYYNTGGAYFKLGELGRAILYYEKARVLIPRDADLKSNLEYAASLIEEPQEVLQRPGWAGLLGGLTNQFDIDGLAVFIWVLYLLLLGLAAINILYGARIKKALTILIGAAGLMFAASSASFAVRVYEKEFLRPAIVIAKEADCAFEPFERSTVYFKAHSGDKIFVLSQKKDWSRIRRPDGKTAWVRNDAIGII